MKAFSNLAVERTCAKGRVGRSLPRYTFMIKYLAVLAALLSLPAQATERRIPLAGGNYKFRYCDVEYVNHLCFDGLDVKIKGRRIWIANSTGQHTGYKGVIEKGTLFWHMNSKQWIIVTKPEDKTATEVGGCGDGPRTIDLEKRIYYTC